MSSTQIPGVDKPTQTIMVIGPDGEPIDFGGGGGGGPSQVEVTNPEDIAPGVGMLSATPFSDDTGAADGSVTGLLKGIYVQNVAIIALLTQIEANTNPG